MIDELAPFNVITPMTTTKPASKPRRSAKSHLSSVDPVMRKLVRKIDLPVLPKRDNNLHTLAEIIVSQQLSGKVARVIFGRVLKQAGVRKLNPDALDRITDKQLRDAGLSNGKVAYIRDLVKKVKDKQVPFRKFDSMSDDEIIESLTQIKGIGRWSAEMYLMFVLKRPDVFSPGDLGIRTAIGKLYGITDPKADLDSFAERWKPYRSAACLYLWQSLNNR